MLEDLKKIEAENDEMNKLFDKVLTFSLTEEEKNKISASFKFETVSPFFTPRDHFPVNTRKTHVWYEFLPNKKLMAGVFSLILLFSGGLTSFAAQSSIPGDLLYPIKIYVNEGTESFFAVSAKSTAKTNAVHAISRLKEIQKLALQDKLSSTTINLAKAKFVEDANSVTESVSKLSQDGDAPSATEVGVDFQTSLQDYQDILTTLSEKQGDQSELLTDIVGTVKTQLYATAALNLSVELANATSTLSTIPNTAFTTATSTVTSTATSTANVTGNSVSTTTATTSQRVLYMTSTSTNSTSTKALKNAKPVQ